MENTLQGERAAAERRITKLEELAERLKLDAAAAEAARAATEREYGYPIDWEVWKRTKSIERRRPRLVLVPSAPTLDE